MNQDETKTSTAIVLAPGERVVTEKELMLLAKEQSAYQVYEQVELQKEREAEQLRTDGGQILQSMLRGLMVAARDSAHDLLHRAAQQDSPVEAARLTNAAARQMSAFQQGLLTLHHVQTPNEQRVTLQQVNVSGGNNVVAANVDTIVPAPLKPAEEN